MPGCHGVEVRFQLPGGPPEDQWVGVSAMVGGQDDAIATAERTFEVVQTADLAIDHAFGPAEIQIV